MLRSGAVDILPKPTLWDSLEQLEIAAFYKKLKMVAQVKVMRHGGGIAASQPLSSPASTGRLGKSEHSKSTTEVNRVVAIGGSTGAPQGFYALLTQLPANYRIPVLCTQHMSPGFYQSMVEWLDENARIRVKLAEQGEPIHPGTAYFAPEGGHLELDHNYCISIDRPKQTNSGYIPSVDVMFESLSVLPELDVTSILLSGMGGDGAIGMRALMQRGAMTIAQDEASCIVYGMPRRAVEIAAVRQQMTVGEMLKYLVKIGHANI